MDLKIDANIKISKTIQSLQIMLSLEFLKEPNTIKKITLFFLLLIFMPLLQPVSFIMLMTRKLN